MAQYYDLNPNQTRSTDGKYVDLVFTGLEPDTDYSFIFAWDYEDPELGNSPFSDPFDFKTDPEPEFAAPEFREEDLDAVSTILYVRWNGKNALGVPYGEGEVKQVNIWIKGGDFGEEYVRFGTSFPKAATIQINTTKSVTYCVKLQAESNSGKLSQFSSEQCVTLIAPPDAPYEVRHEWDKDGNLAVFWKFNATLPKNEMADSFGVQLLDSTNDNDATWWTPVEKDKIPPLEQKIIITSNQLQKVFGEFTAFEIDYDAAIYTRDRNLQTSFVTGYLLTKYSDPLTAPSISVTKAAMAYSVAYTANSTFDRIYIEESVNNGVTWQSQGSYNSNPVYVSTTTSTTRLVRARFSRKLGGFTGYSNTATVTPDKIDQTDTTPPSNPTNISATAAVDANDKTGFSLQATISFTKSSDADCRGYRIRWTTQTVNPVYEYGYVDHPSTGNTVSFTVSGLIPNVTYYYQVASVDNFNNTQTYSTSGTFTAQDSVATAEGSLARLKSYISIGGATGDQFKFGTGILESINTSTTTTPSLSSGTYHGILLNKTGNKNNFWLTTGQIRVGTDTQFMYFNGTDLYLTGDINARSGSITGNLTMTGGGSVIAKTSSGALNKVTLSHLGLFAYDATGTESTQIISNAAAGSPTFTTTQAKIGNWTVATDKISAGGLELNSGGSIIGTSGGSYIGIKPRQSAGTDIVLWSGNTQNPAINSAASGQAGFQVNANGQLYATGAIISGKITVESGSSLGGLLNDTSKVYYSATTPTAPTDGFKVGDGWVDTANNNQLKIWNGTAWIVAQDSESVRSIANTKTKTTYGSTQPSGAISGDVWFDTNTGINYFKVYNGTAWVRMKDSDITAAQSAAATAQSTADSKAQTTYGSSTPVNPKSGDIWFDTNFNYFKRYNGTTWDRMKDADITAAQNAAASAATDATNALSKAAKFGVDGSLVSNLIIENSGAAIYSKYNSGGVIAKDSYASTNAGFYMGWDNQAGVLYPAFNIGNANAYIKWSNYDQTLRIKGNISLNANSDINGTAASTVVSGSTAGASALQPGGNLTGSVDGVPVGTIKSGASAGSSAVQPGNGVTLKNDGTKVINQIDLLASGIKISSASTGTRVEMSNSGLYLYKGSSTTPTVALDAATGDAQFSGTVNASGGTFSGNITASGIITGGTINGATITAGTSNSGGNIRLNSANKNIEFLSSSGTILGRAYVFADNETIIAPGDVSALGYPASTAFISLAANVRTASLIVTNSAGASIGELKLSSTEAAFSGVSVITYQGAPLTSGLTSGPIGYVRNIGMGANAKSTSDTDGVRGDIWIQYA